VIQIFTGDATEHAATYSKGFVMNMSGKGFEKIPFDEWMKEYAINGAKIHIYEAPKEFEKWQDNKMEWFDAECVGLKYDAIFAMFSALDEIKQIRDLDYKSKGQFCSQQSFDRLVTAEYLADSIDKITPAELKRILLKASWKKRRIN